MFNFDEFLYAAANRSTSARESSSEVCTINNQNKILITRGVVQHETEPHWGLGRHTKTDFLCGQREMSHYFDIVNLKWSHFFGIVIKK